MPKTNLQRKTSYYERIIKEAKESLHAEHYKNVCTALEPLIALSTQLKESNKKLTPDEHKNLVQNYTSVLTACKEYNDKQNEFDDFEKSRMKIIQELGTVLTKDLKTLKSANPKELGTLSEIVEKARTYTVEINSNEIKTVGGALSSRIPLKTTNGKKGFFTPKKIFDQSAKWKEQVEKHEAKLGLSEQSKKRLDLLKSNNKIQKIISSSCPKPNATKFDEDTIMRINNMASLLGIVEKSKDAGEFLSDNPQVYDNLYNFCMDIASIAKEEVVMEKAGIETGSEITNRNCAMSDVARLLGCDNLLANSAPMKVIIDGVEVEGVFMETAEGSDIGNIQENDLLLEAEDESFDSPNMFEQLADLQVLDFICGNIDRHAGNIIYQFEKNKRGVTLASIKGIDNDCAFGSPEIREGQKVMRMVNPGEMKYMSAHMAITLTSLTPDMLRAELLNSNLSEREISAACDRLEMVRTEIGKGTFEIKAKEEWNDYLLFMDEGLKDNYFQNMQAVHQACIGDVFKEQKHLRKKEIKYAEGKRNDALVLVGRQESIERLKKLMKDSKSIIFNSSEYNSMKKRFNHVEKLTKQMKEEYTSQNKPVPSELTENLKKSYIELVEKTEKYISLKKLIPETTRGQKRIDFANELLNFAYETMEKIPEDFDKSAKVDKNPAINKDEAEIDMNL